MEGAKKELEKLDEKASAVEDGRKKHLALVAKSIKGNEKLDARVYDLKGIETRVFE